MVDNQSTTMGVVAALLVIFVAGAFCQVLTTPDLRITPSVRRLLVGVGNKQVLDCFITTSQPGSPSDLKWEVPSSTVTYLRMTKTDNKLTYHHYLTIDSFTSDYVGIYKCKYEQMETAITLVTIEEHKTENEFVFGNKSVTLECTLDFTDSSTQGTFHEWLKENSSLSLLKKPERFNDLKNGTLIITDPTRADSGPYVARYNVSGVDLKTYDCEVVYRASPLVLDMSRSKNIVKGDDLRLECLVKGYPRTNVTWKKNDIDMKVDLMHVSMEDLNGFKNAVLLISSVTYEDEGVYTCVAKVPTDEKTTKSIIVRVKDPLQWLWPIIGILCELIALTLIIFTCGKIKKDDSITKPADEREGLLRQGSARNREHDKHA
uniref:Ig-like domain-containing protein n=1 Tax=Arion vulgaris TaxID=1028688 RepID=A0A0B6ZKD4_9EUPU